MATLDLGNPQDWPDVARRIVEGAAAEIRRRIYGGRYGGGEDDDRDDVDHEDDDRRPYACDLAALNTDISDGVEARRRTALDGHHLLAYHATRLLPHEDGVILSGGLHVLSHNLIEEKLRRAAAVYGDLLSTKDLELLRQSGPLTWGHGNRLGLLWVVAPFSIFDGNPGGFYNLQRNWGGEAIGWTNNDLAKAVVARLTKMSSPTIVEVEVPASDFPTWKELWPVPVGSLLDLPEPWIEWAVQASVPHDRVTAIIHPGDPRWPGRLQTA